MEKKLIFTDEETKTCRELSTALLRGMGDNLKAGDADRVKQLLSQTVSEGQIERDAFDLNPILTSLQTALISMKEIGLGRDGILAVMLFHLVKCGSLTPGSSSGQSPSG